MKKKLVVCILCGMMAMSALTCGIGSVFAAESPETPVISAQEGEQIPNPWKEYTSVKDAENAVGFSVKLPKKISGYTKDMISMQGIGYKEMIKYLDGEYTYDEAIEIIKRDSRRYAKRQLTWFKRYQDAKWFDLDKYQDIEILKEDIINHIEKLLEIV